MKQKIPLLILPAGFTAIIAQFFLGFGVWLEHFLPGLSYDLGNARISLDPGKYIIDSIVNAGFISAFVALLIGGLKIAVNQDPVESSIMLAVAFGCALFVLYLGVLLRYPKILATKRAEQVDKNLLFAIKDLLLQVSSGVSLYDGFVNVSCAEYGVVSDECATLVRRVKTGMPMEQALEKMGAETRSEFLRRTAMQLRNTLQSGSSVKGALRTIIGELVVAQRTKIADYAKELNLWTLVYMLFAVAIPSIGSTMMILLASFAGGGANEMSFIVFILVTTFIQIGLIGFVRTRRPVVGE